MNNGSDSTVNPVLSEMSSTTKNPEDVSTISLAAWEFEELEQYIIITLFIMFSGLAKLVFHHLKCISSRVPESCLLIMVGAVFGLIINYVDVCKEEVCDGESGAFPRFTPELFFYGLLPPIILEASYSLHNRVFMENLRTVLLYAVFGTILNFLLIGGWLILCYEYNAMGSNTVYKTEVFQGTERILEPYHLSHHSGNTTHVPVHQQDNETEFTTITSIQILLFASLISAVDPVAVLAVFSEVGVNPDLYFLVFGESLLNDGVAVVLYNMMTAFAGMENKGKDITAVDIVTGIGSFFTVALGGLTIGFTFGILTAFITKFTTEVRVLEPLATFSLAYLAYLAADLVNWSGIISIIGCGMLQAHYTFKNISEQSLITINYFIKMLSSSSECIVFLYLGMALFGNHAWHTGFVCWSLVVCLVVRFIGVFSQTYVVNKLRHGVKLINYQEQFLMAYGGLRGAVGFSLVLLIDKEIVPGAEIFVTTTLAIVICTVFIQGGTIKPLVEILNIDKEKEGIVTLSEEINEKVFEHVMAGVEIISGKMGHYGVNEKLYYLDQKYLKKWLCIPNYGKKMQKMYEKVLVSDHLLHLYGPTVMHSLDNKDEQQHLQGNQMVPADQNSVQGPEVAVVPATPGAMPVFQNAAYEDTERLGVVDPTGPPKKHSFKSAVQTVSWLVSKSSPIIDRTELTTALKKDPMNTLYQVHDKNITGDDGTSMDKVTNRRQKSAKKIREKILEHSGELRSYPVDDDIPAGGSKNLDSLKGSSDNQTVSQPNSMQSDSDYWATQSKNSNSSRVKSLIRNIEGLPREERTAVEAILSKHHEMRRRKSIASSTTLSTPRTEAIAKPPQDKYFEENEENIDTTQL